MKKLLCTASLLLAFSMSSFANTNETKVVSNPESKTVIAADEDCYLVTITEQWIEQDGPEDDPNSYTFRYKHHRFIVCLD